MGVILLIYELRDAWGRLVTVLEDLKHLSGDKPGRRCAKGRLPRPEVVEVVIGINVKPPVKHIPETPKNNV
eukprot:7038449-Pyramimonas_sp.AAC.1